MTSIRVRINEGRLDSVVGESTAELINEAMDAGVELAQRLVPVESGDLQASIDIIGFATEGDLSGSYGATEDYAEHVEFGTFKMAAQPYMRPSLDAVTRYVR